LKYTRFFKEKLNLFEFLAGKARARFTAVRAAVATRAADLSKQLADQQAFMAQKDQAGGKKTLKAYYWAICGQEYDAQH